jgi:hypothetical protein
MGALGPLARARPRGWNQRVTGFPIVHLVFEGMRCVFYRVNSLPANYPVAQSSRLGFRGQARARGRARGISRFATGSR